jgi:uncharacterized protein YecE (DUF72 family)
VLETVEVNATFYRLPKRKSVARWVEQMRPGFAAHFNHAWKDPRRRTGSG